MFYYRLVTQESFPEKEPSFETIETLISYLFLTPKKVYKVKKPVNLEFCNFTTLPLRKKFCHREFEKNRRLSPEMYEQVVPVSQVGERILFNNSSCIIDYALVMKRYPEERKMSNLLMTNQLEGDTVTKLGHALAVFHRELKVPPHAADYGFDNLANLWVQNFQQTESLNEEILTKSDFQEMKQIIELFLRRSPGLFRNRLEENYVKEIHGDFHSENVFIIEDTSGEKIQIFDAIEFNPSFYTFDVLADLNFMMMDLDYWGKSKLGSDLLAGYLEKYDRPGVWQTELVNFYLAYYAYVRGKIWGIRVAQMSDLKSKELEKLVRKARQYFLLARQYCQKLM